MPQGHERGQALLEAILVAPLFLIGVLGVIAYGNLLKAQTHKDAWEQTAAQTTSVLSPELRKRAKWPNHAATVDAELLAARQREAKKNPASAALCTSAEPHSFCFDAHPVPARTSRTNAVQESSQSPKEIEGSATPAAGIPAWRAALFASRRNKFSLRSPYTPESRVRFENRAPTLAQQGLAHIVHAMPSGMPAHRVAPYSEAWEQGGGFHMDSWLGVGHGPGSPSHGLERVLAMTAGRSRALQLAACMAESSKTLMVGGLVEILSTLAIPRETGGDGCPAVRTILTAQEHLVHLSFRVQAGAIVAREACASTSAAASTAASSNAFAPFSARTDVCGPKPVPSELLSQLAALARIRL